jgi:hypothetical protein
MTLHIIQWLLFVRVDVILLLAFYALGRGWKSNFRILVSKGILCVLNFSIPVGPAILFVHLGLYDVHVFLKYLMSLGSPFKSIN